MTDPQASADDGNGNDDRPTERDHLLRAVRHRIDAVGGPAGNAHLHTEDAGGEADRLLRHLVLTPGDDPAAAGVDAEVAYVLGVLYLCRADDRPQAPTGEQEARLALLLLGSFYYNPPGQQDVLPPPLRAGLDQIIGPDGRRPADPDAAVQAHAEALANLAMLLIELAIGLPYPAAAPASAGLLRAALPYLAAEGPDRAVAGCNLGYALLLSAPAPGPGPGPGPEQITEAVAVLRTAFAATAREHPNHARCANGLGLALLNAAAHAEDRTQLPEAAAMFRIATRTATELDENLPQMWADLGHTLILYGRSAEAGDEVEPAVREEAVQALRQALELTPAQDEESLRVRLDRLADAALIGCPGDDRPQAAAQAGEAVEPLRRLLTLTPDGHPDHADVTLRLAANLIAARHPQEATDLLVGGESVFAGDTERMAAVETLLVQAAMLQGEVRARSELTPEQEEARQAIDEMLRPALSGEAADTPDNPLSAVMRLVGLGPQTNGSRNAEMMEFANLVVGFGDRTGVADVFAKAMELEAKRIARLPEEERAQALAALLEGELEGADGDAAASEPPQEVVDTRGVDELLECHERLEPRIPAGSREHRFLRAMRAMLLMAKAMNTPGDVKTRLRAMRQTLPLMQEFLETLPALLKEVGITPELFGAHAALMFSDESPFDQLELLEDAVKTSRRELATLATGSPETDSPERTEARITLAMSLFTRHVIWSDEADFEEAQDIARELTAAPEPPPRTALLLTQWSSVTLRRVQNTGLLRSGPPQEGRSPSLVTRLASDGAVTALERHDPVEALETLEDGRSHLLSGALNARRELAELHGTDAALHARLRAALERVRTHRQAIGPGRWPAPDKEAEYRTAAEEAARIVAELQQRPQFQRFLTPLPLSLDNLLPAAAEGPVVSINVNPRRCDALALCPDGLHSIPLPRLDAADLAAQAESFRLAVETLNAGPRDPLFEDSREVFTGTLAWLWDVLAEPVLDALGFTGPPEPGVPWPRLWWSPSGVLNSFPLHAAGRHGGQDTEGASVLDRVASSYTPTLRALLFSRARTRAASGRRHTLAVAVPETSGHPSLSRTVAEAADAVASGGGLPLIGPAATRDAVRAALVDAAVVHFACHAGSDPEDLAASRLLLSDGDLQLNDIAALRLDNAQLAYLSACGTARGSASPALADEAVHLASAFQLAGYSQSVATLWEVGDAFASTAASVFHRALAPSMAAADPLPAALALHRTVSSLRHSHRDRPWTWASLVHAGA
ncbi:CHAT domain-containing protein [Streptomyces sp. NPDC048441]|uniref:CHAT domain-containing tetratricopeptide repeat protein n=1 Tax=Streptomyces sp. NPDC048441 TaxID=3365552 RepID=UPI00371CA8DD